MRALVIRTIDRRFKDTPSATVADPGAQRAAKKASFPALTLSPRKPQRRHWPLAKLCVKRVS